MDVDKRLCGPVNSSYSVSYKWATIISHVDYYLPKDCDISLRQYFKKYLAIHEGKWQVHDQLPFCYLICSKSVCNEKTLDTGPFACGIQLAVSSEAFAKGHLKVPAAGLGGDTLMGGPSCWSLHALQ